MSDDILAKLTERMGVKNSDGSYNKLAKSSEEITREGEFRLQFEAYRDKVQAPINKRDEMRYEIQKNDQGLIYATSINEILSTAYLNGASDIHIMSGTPPKMRLHGELLQMPYEVLTPSICKRILSKIMTEDQYKEFEESGDIDFSYALEGVCRFRVNMYRQRGSWGAVFRSLSNNIPKAMDLGIPKAVQDLASKKRGLILVTGPTGSGKSTSLASLLRIINETRRENIITLEDPIEYVHKNKLSSIAQREIGLDCKSFAAGIRAALREDPDVILIGEMRDPETIATAVTAAETGHLVFSTLHTIGAAPTIDRIIDSFPEGQQNQIRIQLASVLEAVISQQLIRTADGNGRVAAFEVMLANPAIRNLIREKKVEQMLSIMQTNKKMGMVTMDDYILSLCNRGIITKEKAIEYAVDKSGMEKNTQTASMSYI